MSIVPNTVYPTKTAAPSAGYPQGSARNITAPGDGLGTPLEKQWVNDLFGLQQALLRAGGITPSGTPDTALVSQYMQAIVELASGRADNYAEAGIADAYVLGAQTNQQTPNGVFAGMVMKFFPGNTNTGACTVNPFGTGVINIKAPGGTLDPSAGDILVGDECVLVYRTSPGIHAELQPRANKGRIVQQVNVQDGAVATGTTILPIDDTIPQNTEGDQFMTASITPTRANNLLRIQAILNLSNGSAGPAGITAALFQDAIASALAVAWAGREATAAARGAAVLDFIMPAGTTSLTTFNVRAGAGSASTTTFNGGLGSRLYGGVYYSSLTITEIGQ